MNSKMLLWGLGSLVIFLSFPIYYLLLSSFFEELSERAHFGDSFGSINAFFSAMAFLGVIVTILMQRDELRTQRQEKDLSRIEDNKRKTEQAVFLMLELHLDIIDKLELVGKTKRDVFEVYLTSIQTSSKELEAFGVLNKLTPTDVLILEMSEDPLDIENRINLANFSENEIVLLKELSQNKSILELYKSNELTEHQVTLKKALKSSLRIHKQVLSHYFKNLFNIFKTINESDVLTEQEKSWLASVVVTQLSMNELKSVFYSCFFDFSSDLGLTIDVGFNSNRKLIEAFGILNEIGSSQVFHKSHLEIFAELLKSNRG